MHFADITQRLFHHSVPRLAHADIDRRGSIPQTYISDLPILQTTRRTLHSLGPGRPLLLLRSNSPCALYPNPRRTFYRCDIQGTSKVFDVQGVQNHQELLHNIAVLSWYQFLHQDRLHTFAPNQKQQAHSHFGIQLAVVRMLSQSQVRYYLCQTETHEPVCIHLSILHRVQRLHHFHHLQQAQPTHQYHQIYFLPVINQAVQIALHHQAPSS